MGLEPPEEQLLGYRVDVRGTEEGRVLRGVRRRLGGKAGEGLERLGGDAREHECADRLQQHIEPRLGVAGAVLAFGCLPLLA